jgi:hypothetical protein
MKRKEGTERTLIYFRNSGMNYEPKRREFGEAYQFTIDLIRNRKIETWGESKCVDIIKNIRLQMEQIGSIRQHSFKSL